MTFNVRKILVIQWNTLLFLTPAEH